MSSIMRDRQGSVQNRLVPHAFPTSAPRLSNLLVGRCSKNDSFPSYERCIGIGARTGRCFLERSVEARVYSFERDETARFLAETDGEGTAFFAVFFSLRRLIFIIKTTATAAERSVTRCADREDDQFWRYREQKSIDPTSDRQTIRAANRLVCLSGTNTPCRSACQVKLGQNIRVPDLIRRPAAKESSRESVTAWELLLDSL